MPRASIIRWVKFSLAAVVIILVLAGQAMFLFESFQATQGTGPSTIHGHTFAARLDEMLRSALGPSDRNVRRFHVTAIQPDPTQKGRKRVIVTWSINNDILSGTIGNGAQFDAYAVFRAVYTSGLPVSRLTLIGTYPMRAGTRVGESVVMRLAMDRQTARTIAKVGWDSLDAQSVWPLIERRYVAPELAPSSTE